MAAPPDAIALLEAKQRALQRLFADYAGLVRGGASFAQRRSLAERICTELAIRRRLREELVDPAAGLEAGAAAGVAESVAQVLAASGDEQGYDALLAALRERVERDLGCERDVVLPRLRAARVDLAALARALTQRQQELQTVADALREDALASALL